MYNSSLLLAQEKLDVSRQVPFFDLSNSAIKITFYDDAYNWQIIKDKNL